MNVPAAASCHISRSVVRASSDRAQETASPDAEARNAGSPRFDERGRCRGQLPSTRGGSENVQEMRSTLERRSQRQHARTAALMLEYSPRISRKVRPPVSPDSTMVTCLSAAAPPRPRDQQQRIAGRRVETVRIVDHCSIASNAPKTYQDVAKNAARADKTTFRSMDNFLQDVASHCRRQTTARPRFRSHVATACSDSAIKSATDRRSAFLRVAPRGLRRTRRLRCGSRRELGQGSRSKLVASRQLGSRRCARRAGQGRLSDKRRRW